MAPVTPTCEPARLSCRRSHFSNRQYSPTPAIAPGPLTTTRSPLTAPTSASAKFSSNRSSASVAHVCLTSAKTTIGVLCRRHALRQRRGLAHPSRQLQHMNKLVLQQPCDPSRFIGRAVGDEDDLAIDSGRLQDADQFPQSAGDASLFVMRTEDERDAARAVHAAPHRSGTQTRPGRQEQRIEHVRIQDEPGARPEGDLKHGSASRFVWESEGSLLANRSICGTIVTAV